MLALTEAVHCKVEDLEPSPIEPSWIIEGNPEARSRLLSTSPCKTAWTLVWFCTQGMFNWHYHFEETIVILEGSIVVESDGVQPKRYGAGDVILFRTGTRAKWHIEDYVKKVAFCRLNNPFPLGLAIRVSNKLKSLITRTHRSSRLACKAQKIAAQSESQDSEVIVKSRSS
jgi:uncharacterized cupin superfamily protein